jgi:hypothetical protein
MKDANTATENKIDSNGVTDLPRIDPTRQPTVCSTPKGKVILFGILRDTQSINRIACDATHIGSMYSTSIALAVEITNIRLMQNVVSAIRIFCQGFANLDSSKIEVIQIPTIARNAPTSQLVVVAILIV